jgi:hypothetical protein
MFFSLDRKEPKDQDCESLAKNFIRNAMEIKLVSLRESSNRNFHLTHFSFILLTPSI